jgi:hypothetical protein
MNLSEYKTYKIEFEYNGEIFHSNPFNEEYKVIVFRDMLNNICERFSIFSENYKHILPAVKKFTLEFEELFKENK